MSDRDDKILFKQGGGVFLDPHNVGSSVLYRVKVYYRGRRKKANAEVELRDCDSKILWHGWGRDGLDEMERKLVTAINSLSGALASVRAAKTRFDKRHKPEGRHKRNTRSNGPRTRRFSTLRRARDARRRA